MAAAAAGAGAGMREIIAGGIAMYSLENYLQERRYPGRGVLLGLHEDGIRAVAAYFIMGRSENSRNRIFITEGDGLRTEAFDPAK